MLGLEQVHHLQNAWLWVDNLSLPQFPCLLKEKIIIIVLISELCEEAHIKCLE